MVKGKNNSSIWIITYACMNKVWKQDICWCVMYKLLNYSMLKQSSTSIIHPVWFSNAYGSIWSMQEWPHITCGHLSYLLRVSFLWSRSLLLILISLVDNTDQISVHCCNSGPFLATHGDLLSKAFHRIWLTKNLKTLFFIW